MHYIVGTYGSSNYYLFMYIFSPLLYLCMYVCRMAVSSEIPISSGVIEVIHLADELRYRLECEENVSK